MRTLVLNADFRPLTIISWKRAIVLVAENRVQQLDFYKGRKLYDGRKRAYTIPAVVVVSKYVKRDYRNAPFCRKNILLRDALTCQYCGDKLSPSKLTFDHVIPKSVWKRRQYAGTPTTWENIVTCCLPCNRKKADMTCEEAGMFPTTAPIRPAYGELFLGLSPWREFPDEWRPYLCTLPLFKNFTIRE